MVTFLIGLEVSAFILLAVFSKKFRGEKLQSEHGWLYVLGLFALIVATLVVTNALGVNID